MEIRIGILLVILALLIAWAHPVKAANIYVIEFEDAAVTITDEPCKLKSVGNLPTTGCIGLRAERTSRAVPE